MVAGPTFSRFVLPRCPRYNLGYIQEELGQIDSAIQSFKKALEIKPDDKDALINLGNCFMNVGRHQESIDTYLKAIKVGDWSGGV